METTDLPLIFVWGLLDQVSGAHVIDEVRARIATADVRAVPDIAHWPSLEAPADVTSAVRDLLAN